MPRSKQQSQRAVRVTAKDVARAVGVSPGTVSNAFNQPHQLSASLRERVLATARAMSYTPNPAARSLRLGKSGLVGFVYPDPLSFAFSDPTAILFLRGLARETEAAGLSLVFVPGSLGGTGDSAALLGIPVDGFVVYSLAEDDPLAEATAGRGLPTVYVDRDATPGAATVTTDDYGGAKAAAEHLLELGHRRFGVVSLELSANLRSGLATLERQASATYRPMRERLRGYRAALEASGMLWEDVPVYECATNARAEGLSGAKTLLSQPTSPTALLVMSDQLAFGALEAARDLSLDVPRDVSVVGFDDVPEASLSRPLLTTVRQPLEEKGRAAGQSLVAQLQGKTLPTRHLSVELVIRGTTAAPKDVER